MALSWLVSVTVAAAGSTCPAAAADVAQERYARADYAGAIAALAEVEVCPDGKDSELAAALRWRAQAKGATGDVPGAIDAWALLWTVLPTYELDPLESPKFHEQYAAGRSRAASDRRVFARLVRTLPGRAVVQVFDPHGRVKRVAVVYDKRETTAARQGDGTYEAVVPEGALFASAVLESSEAVVFRTLKVMLDELPGSRELVARPAPMADRTRTVLLVGAGAVVAIAVGAVITAAALGARRIEGSLGRVELP